MKILNFGSCNIDYVYTVSHFVSPGETLSSEKLELFPGGKGLNQSIAIARSGAVVYHAGCVGKDGRFLLDIMENSGVDVSYVRVLDTQSGHAIIQVDSKGENCILLHGGANFQIETDYIDEVLSNFSAGDIIVLQNEISNLDYIIDKAYKLGMKIVLNPSPFNNKLKNIDLNKIFTLVLNEIEAFEFSGEKEPEKILQFFKKHYKKTAIMLTLGKKGSVYSGLDSDDAVFYPAFRVKAVDTTSAGDTFTGYFISGLLNGLDIKQILKISTAASAITVSRMGASTSIPTVGEVNEALKTLKSNNVEEDKNDKIILKIKEYIAEDIISANLTDLAKLLGYSVSHMAVWIKNHTGFSFTELVQNERCNYAATLLRETDIPVETVVKLSGYENGSYFRRIFKEIYGKSPLNYRNFYQDKEKLK